MQILAGEYRNTCTCFDLIIDEFMTELFSFSEVVLEVDFIPTIFAEKGFDSQG